MLLLSVKTNGELIQKILDSHILTQSNTVRIEFMLNSHPGEMLCQLNHLLFKSD